MRIKFTSRFVFFKLATRICFSLFFYFNLFDDEFLLQRLITSDHDDDLNSGVSCCFSFQFTYFTNKKKKIYLVCYFDIQINVLLMQEVLRVERELLQLEQEELMRQRNNQVYREREQKQQQQQQHQNQMNGKSMEDEWKAMQDVNHNSSNGVQNYKRLPIIDHRSSMPNLQILDGQKRRPPLPPIPPAKPLRLIEQMQRDATIR